MGKKSLNLFLLVCSLFLFVFVLASCDNSSNNNPGGSNQNNQGGTGKTDDSSTNPVDPVNPGTNDNVYYTITFKDYDGEVLQTSSVKDGELPTYDKTNPTRENDDEYSYTFNGWNPSISKASKDVVYTATYTNQKLPYHITINLDGGNSSQTKLEFGTDKLSKDLLPFDVKKPGFAFKGYELNNVKVFDENGNVTNDYQPSANMTFKAIYEESVALTIFYTIYNPKTNQLITTYDNKPDEIGVISETRNYSYNTYVDLSADLNEGYTFVGWYNEGQVLSNEKEYKYMMWNEDFTIEARIDYTLYDLNVWSNNTELGQVMIRKENDQTFYNDEKLDEHYNETVTIAAYSKTDTRFLGWYDENNNLVSTNAVYTFDMLNRDYKLEAKWNSFDITYDLDGGVNNSSNPKKYNADMENIKLNNPQKEGFTFVGWKFNDNIIDEIDVSNICHMELKAEWANYSVKTEVKDNVGGSTTYSTLTNVTVGETITVTATSFKGYNFIGWYADGKIVTTESSFEYTMQPVNAVFIAEFELDEVLNPFIVYSYDDTLIVYGVKDTSVEEITIPGIVTHIGKLNDGSSAFAHCPNLKTIIIEEGVKVISSNAFEDCKMLSTIVIPNSLWSIGDYAFYRCTSLTKIIVPNGVNVIGRSAFAGCSLEEIVLPFIGERRYSSSSNSNYPFGYIFGGNTDGSKQDSYAVPSSLKKVTITDCTRVGKYDFYKCGYIEEITLPVKLEGIANNAFEKCGSLKVVNIPEGDTKLSLGTNVFSSSGLKEIKLPKRVISIDEGCFSKCYLKKMEIPFAGKSRNQYTTINGATYNINHYPFGYIFGIVESGGVSQSYYGSAAKVISKNFAIPSTLEEVIITDMEYIQYGAFSNCKNLKKLVLPSNLSRIESNAFAGCINLENVYYDGNVENWCSILFTNEEANPMSLNSDFYMLDENGLIEYNDNRYSKPTEIIIPDSVTRINSYAFYSNNDIVSVTVSNGVTSIGPYAFYECEKLESVDLPNSITSISYRLFYGCSSLESIKMSDSIIDIGYEAFYNCSSLKGIILPNSVTSIGYKAFYNCSSLENIIIPVGLNSINEMTFYGCKSLKNIIIPEGVTIIGKNAFRECSNLENIQIPNSVTYIGESAFYECRNLKSIKLPNNITTINNYTFCDCSNLESIVISNSVKTINEKVFYLCSKLAKVYYEGGSPYSNIISTIKTGNDRLTSSTWYYFTANGENEMETGRWWYYDNDGVTIIEKIVQ